MQYICTKRYLLSTFLYNQYSISVVIGFPAQLSAGGYIFLVLDMNGYFIKLKMPFNFRTANMDRRVS